MSRRKWGLRNRKAGPDRFQARAQFLYSEQTVSARATAQRMGNLGGRSSCLPRVPVVREGEVHAKTHRPCGHHSSVHSTGNVATEDLVFRPQHAQGGARKEWLATQRKPVCRIDGCCQHLHEDFVGLRRRLLDLRHPKRPGRPYFSQMNAFMTDALAFR